MKLLQGALFALPLLQGAALAQGSGDEPTLVSVTLPLGTIVGVAGKVESFKGIPFADSPEGSLRLRPPRRRTEPLGTFNATTRAASCPQMPLEPDAKTGTLSVEAQEEITAANRVKEFTRGNPVLSANEDDIGQEDCLTVTVERPLGTKEGDKLPVLFWIFGGAFAQGATNQYPAEKVLLYAQERGQPFVFVAVNYRVGGFGFMGGKEILRDGSSNLGLLDQRMGLEWTADNIEAFGGDPRKVTIFGESAGAISVFDQLILNGGNAGYKGNSLFRAAIMNSGTATPTDPIDSKHAQDVYDKVIAAAECDKEPGEGQDEPFDTLGCLRNLTFTEFLDAAAAVPRVMSYTSLALSYVPRPDGKVLADSPEVLAASGKIHAVPMIAGDQEDEGTLFAFTQYNVTTTDRLVDYFSSIFFSHASKEQVRDFVTKYPDESSAGSPYRTGDLYDISYWDETGIFKRGFKRMAAILGDIVFILARRLSIEAILESKPETPIWSYLNSQDHYTIQVGTAHGFDIIRFFFGDFPVDNLARAYYLNFLYNLDPNNSTGANASETLPAWPRWSEGKDLLWVKSREDVTLLKDDFRSAAYDYMKENTTLLYF